MFNVLQSFDLVYLGTPYTKYPGGIERAFQDAAALAAKLLIRKVNVYSPIAHTHPLAMYGCLKPLDHKIWLPFDGAMMRKADAILVAQMSTWETSYGIKHEIEQFAGMGKPVLYLNVESLAVSVQP